jgi:hypothetical protein
MRMGSALSIGRTALFPSPVWEKAPRQGRMRAGQSSSWHRPALTLPSPRRERVPRALFSRTRALQFRTQDIS